MPTATVTSKGQITIPAEVRKSLSVQPGDKIDIVEVEKGQYVLTAKTKSIRDLRGCVPKLDYVPTIEQMNEAVMDAVAESYLRSVGKLPPEEEENSAA